MHRCAFSVATFPAVSLGAVREARALKEGDIIDAAASWTAAALCRFAEGPGLLQELQLFPRWHDATGPAFRTPFSNEAEGPGLLQELQLFPRWHDATGLLKAPKPLGPLTPRETRQRSSPRCASKNGRAPLPTSASLYRPFPLYRCTRAEPPFANARTCSTVDIVVSPGKVVSSAPCAHPSLTDSSGDSPASRP